MILKDRIAVVTGAGSGIGRASAIIMAREGAAVVVSDRDGRRAEETSALIRETGGLAEAATCDVADDDAANALIDGTIQRHGRVDILHSHVGIQVEGTLEECTPGGMDDSWGLNVRAHFVLARKAMPAMRTAGRGSIIITASNSGVQYDREMVAYATSKHAVVAMTRQIAADYARHGIRVNALCPGWVDTPFNDPFMRQMGGRAALERYVAEQIPMGRFGTAEEIAESVLFLASDRSSFVTGLALVVDGGECL